MILKEYIDPFTGEQVTVSSKDDKPPAKPVVCSEQVTVDLYPIIHDIP